MKDVYSVKGKRVAKLICVAVGGKTKSSNKFYHMYEQNDGTFLAMYGREGNKATTKQYPMSEWDSTLKSKLNRKVDPYTDVTHLFIEEASESNFDPFSKIENERIRDLMLAINGFARNSVLRNYSISPSAVTKIQLNAAQDRINSISQAISNQHIDIKKLNDSLLDLYHIIPRKMNDVTKYLCDLSSIDPLSVFVRIIGEEQLTLDTLAGQIVVSDKADCESSESILDMLGLNIEIANSQEINMIKDMMKDSVQYFSNAYKVSNSSTQELFDRHLSSSNNKSTKLLWHGSRNENWLNIMSSGLLIRPAGAVHTGSMFGDGIYGADLARKSIGYTSINGSYWSKGNSNVAYLALYDFHIGKQHTIKKHTNSCYSLNKDRLKSMGVDSIFALKGADLRNNEYVIYEKGQCTISYLVEIKKP